MSVARSHLTVCPLCQSAVSEPRILPCMDSFCLSCLRSHYEDTVPGDHVQCPVCTEPFAIPDLGVASLKRNSFLTQLLQASIAADRNVSCDVCHDELGDCSNEQDNTAVSYCGECNQYLCERCRRYHSKMTATKHHALTSTGGKDKYNRIPKQGSKTCDKHEDEQLILFCHDCNGVVCLKCNFEQHKSHRCEYIDDVAIQFRDQIREKLGTLMTCLDENLGEQQDLEKDLADVRNQIDQVELWVTCKKEQLKRCLESDARELINELRELRDYVSEEYGLAGQKAKDKHDRVARLVEFSSSLLSDGSDMVLSSTALDLCRRAEELLADHQRRHAKHLYRPSVEVNLRSLGLEHLSASRRPKHKINLIGRISALVVAAEHADKGDLSSCSQSTCPTGDLTKDATRVLQSGKRGKEEFNPISNRTNDAKLTAQRRKGGKEEFSPPILHLSSVCRAGIRVIQAGSSGTGALDASDESSDEETALEPSRNSIETTVADSADERTMFCCQRTRLYCYKEGEWVVIGSGQLKLSMIESDVYLMLKQKLVSLQLLTRWLPQ